jgi:hypothetical protein
LADTISNKSLCCSFAKGDLLTNSTSTPFIRWLYLWTPSFLLFFLNCECQWDGSKQMSQRPLQRGYRSLTVPMELRGSKMNLWKLSCGSDVRRTYATSWVKQFTLFYPSVAENEGKYTIDILNIIILIQLCNWSGEFINILEVMAIGKWNYIPSGWLLN